MIIRGNPAGNVGFWSKHLLRDDTNDRAEVKEISGLLAEDLPTALREMKAIADQSRSHGNFMYQANINPQGHEHLTDEQWREAVDTLEKNLGLEGHQRVVVEHEKEGRTHRHIIWNRVDENLRVADMGGNYRIHTATQKELESRFDLSPTPERDPEKKSAQELWENRAAERSGIDPAAMKAEMTELWRGSDSGKAFAAAVDERGYILAKGDRRDFCIVDQAGDAHSLARRLDCVKAKDVREHMADIDRAALPTVAEARETQRARPAIVQEPTRAAQPEPAASVIEPTPAAPEATKAAPEIAPEWNLDEGADAAAWAKFLNKEQAEREGGAEYMKLPPLPYTTPIEKRINDLHGASRTNGAFAAALYREGLTIAFADAAGIRRLDRERGDALREGNPAYGPQHLKEGELVAVNRFGGVHSLNPKRINHAELYAALTEGARTIPTLSNARSYVQSELAADKNISAQQSLERGERRREREAENHEKWLEYATEQRARAQPDPVTPVLSVAVGLKVGADKLVDFVSGLLSGGASQPAPTPASISQREQIIAQRKTLAAIESIRDSMERGQGLKAEDIRHLTPNHLENIKLRGDDYVRSLIEAAERARERERDYGRERER